MSKVNGSATDAQTGASGFAGLQYEPAPISARVCAAASDVVILLIYWVGASYLASQIFPSLEQRHLVSPRQQRILMDIVLLGVPPLAYILTICLGRQTYGMKTQSLLVVDANELAPSYARAIIRVLIMPISLTLFVWYPRVRRDRRSLHDVISGTRVVTELCPDREEYTSRPLWSSEEDN